MKIVKLKRSDDLILELPEGWGKEGEKVSITHDKNGVITISKFVNIELDFDDELFLKIAMEAHEKDITFNEMVSEILTEVIDKHENASD